MPEAVQNNEAPPDSAAVEQEARSMGWRPESEFKGDPSKFVPADEYVRRGKEVLPFLKANNQKLQNEIATLRSQLTESQKLVKESTEAIENLKEFQSSIALERVKEKKPQLIAAIRQAREDGDVEKEAELTDELSNINTAIREAENGEPKKKKETKEETVDDEPVTQELRPDTKAFIQANSWFGGKTKEDRRKTEMAVALAREIKQENPDLEGGEFFAELEVRLTEFFGTNTAPSKVESSRPGSAASRGAKGYAQLPAEAKAAAERFEKRMVGTGPGKFKNTDEWRKHYAEQYWSNEE